MTFIKWKRDGKKCGDERTERERKGELENKMPERRKWKLYNFGRNLSNSLRCMMMDIHTHTHRHFDEMGLFGSFRSHFFYFPRNCFSIFVVAFSWMRNRKILSSHESTKKISFAFNEIGRMKSSKRWFAYACIFLLSRFIYSLPFFCEDKMTWLRFSFVWIHIFARFHHAICLRSFIRKATPDYNFCEFFACAKDPKKKWKK